MCFPDDIIQTNAATIVIGHDVKTNLIEEANAYVIVTGSFFGNITAGQITLCKSAGIDGEITASKLIMDPRARLKGRVHMRQV
jgi:cytoskeletal protein CcmA (bactofilin family)